MGRELYELNIDPEFEGMIPPLSGEEQKMLEESILRSGCDTPLTVWNRTVVDGHNRYRICRKHGIPFAIDERAFESREVAICWMLEHQLARRNLNSYQRSELVLRYEPILKEEAKRRQATSTGSRMPPLPPNLAEAETRGDTRDHLARMAGVAHGTIDKVRRLEAVADEKTKQDLRSGRRSIHSAYTDLVTRRTGQGTGSETRLCTCCGKELSVTDFPRRKDSTVCKACAGKRQRIPEYSGLEVVNGQLAHVERKPEDVPETFHQVLSVLDFANENYILNIRHAFEMYTTGVRTDENRAVFVAHMQGVLNVVTQMIQDVVKEDK